MFTPFPGYTGEVFVLAKYIFYMKHGPPFSLSKYLRVFLRLDIHFVNQIRFVLLCLLYARCPFLAPW